MLVSSRLDGNAGICESARNGIRQGTTQIRARTLLTDRPIYRQAKRPSPSVADVGYEPGANTRVSMAKIESGCGVLAACFSSDTFGRSLTKKALSTIIGAKLHCIVARREGAGLRQGGHLSSPCPHLLAPSGLLSAGHTSSSTQLALR